jgi:hypothetical protein
MRSTLAVEIGNRRIGLATDRRKRKHGSEITSRFARSRSRQTPVFNRDLPGLWRAWLPGL